jgi:hypothetical protein
VKGWLIVVMRYEEEEEEIWYCRERGEFWRWWTVKWQIYPSKINPVNDFTVPRYWYWVGVRSSGTNLIFFELEVRKLLVAWSSGTVCEFFPNNNVLKVARQ